MKFKPGREVLPEGFGTGMYFQQGHREGGSDNVRSPLSLSLFTIRGVKGVFLGKDFITVTKQPDDSWMALKPQVGRFVVLAIISMDNFAKQCYYLLTTIFLKISIS